MISNLALRAVGLLAVVLLLLVPGLRAQQSAAAPRIAAIEPPEWWANMPAPMLLVRGEHLQGVRFHLSDPRLRIASINIAGNGHWAELRLGASPAAPEQVRVIATNAQGTVSAPYSFGRRKAASEGFAGFSSKDVMYLIMTDRFADGDPSNDGLPAERAAPRGWHGGDLRGVTEHLDYLQALGITTVWITPVYQNHEAQSYHGYGATDLYAVDEHYGTLADLRSLGAELHRRHMKLVLDTVPNHIGPGHPWVEDEPEPDWFHGTKAEHHKAIGEFAPLVNPHAPWRDQRDILQGWFANTLPDMNQENPDAAAYLTQNAIWWVEQTGADGLRIDTFPYVGRPFWHSFHASLHALYPELTTVGEVFNGNPVVTSAFAGGSTRGDLNGSVDTGLTTPFDFPSYFAIRAVLLKGAPMTHMAEVLGEDSLYPHPERLVPFLGNHDTRRFLGEEGATPATLKLAFAMLLTMRGMPQIYAGDEIAMTGGEDPDNRHDFPGGFPGDAGNAFTAAGRTAAQADMHDWVAQLLSLRATHPELSAGEEQVLHADADTLVYVRGSDLDSGCGSAAIGAAQAAAAGAKARVLVAINKAAEPRTVTLDTENTALAGCQAGGALLGTMTREGQSWTLPPGASMVAWH